MKLNGAYVGIFDNERVSAILKFAQDVVPVLGRVVLALV